MQVGIIGGGVMGVGIAHRFSARGAEVAVVDVDLDAATASVERTRATLDKAVDRGKLEPEAAEGAKARLRPVAAIEELPVGLDVVVEAIIEDLEAKRAVLVRAESREPRVLATNTSSISIDRLAEPLAHPERFCGMHFFNPVWAMDLVEVIRGSATAPETVERVLEIVEFLGMEPAVVNDAPGFATTRLGIVLGLEAIRMVEEGVAEPADIDRAMELGYGYPMGPLKTGDLVGLDVRLAIAEHLATVYGERFEPPRLLRQMVAEGRLGKKVGRGFYEWD